jgi:uncharacterized protein (TIGR03083 family)
MTTLGPGDGSDYLDHLARDSARFLEAVLATTPEARVPTCPGWTGDDLLWHLAEVQWFWGRVVRTRADDPDAVEAAKPDRPGDRDGLVALYWQSGAELQAVLAQTSPQAAVWTWAADRTAGFVRRRQAHEALIHRLDAELTAGARSGIDPALAADGVDEVLGVMFGDVPEWATSTSDPQGACARIVATDVDRAWLVTFGRWSGTSPNTGRSYDDPALWLVPDDGREAATVTGRAADLDCLLWNRPTEAAVTRSGDERSLALLDAVVAVGVQ